MQKSPEHDHATPVVIPPTRPGGRHRLPAPPASLRGRAAVLAVAAGASVSAAYAGSLVDPGLPETGGDVSLLALGESAAPAAAETAAPSTSTATAVPSAPELVASSTDTSAQDSMVSSLLAGTEVNTRREIDEEKARRPKVVKPAEGSYTSNYAMRWGVFHGGIDLAAPLGTPIVAAMDGTVIDSGPAQGFGQWIRVMSDDGTMTVYGHMSVLLAPKGARVSAGQLIALMGAEGFSTGSHLHFEVWINGGKDRTDPEPWLRANGVDIGPYQGG